VIPNESARRGRLDDRKRELIFGCTLSAFVGSFSLLERKWAIRFLPLFGTLTLLTVLLLYSSFISIFFREIVPALMASDSGRGAGRLVADLGRAVGRVPSFYGYIYPPLSVVGLYLAYRRVKPDVFTAVAAYGVAFLILICLRGLGGPLFKDLKEILFVGPFVALTAGACLEIMGVYGRRSRVVSVLLLGGLIVFGLCKYNSYLQPWVSLVGVS
jgi:hypothetical protein